MSLGKRISFVEVFFISMFLTPIVGIIAVLKTKSNILKRHYYMTRTCESCDSVGFENEKVCPKCGDVLELSYHVDSKLNLA